MSLDQVTSKVSSNSKICEPIKVPSLGNFSSAALGRRSVQVGSMSQGLGAKAAWPLDGFSPVLQGEGKAPRGLESGLPDLSPQDRSQPGQ